MYPIIGKNLPPSVEKVLSVPSKDSSLSIVYKENRSVVIGIWILYLSLRHFICMSFICKPKHFRGICKGKEKEEKEEEEEEKKEEEEEGEKTVYFLKFSN